VAGGDAALYSVIAGLAVGIMFIVIVASIFQAPISPDAQQPLGSEPMPFQFREAAIRIALQNSTLHDVVDNRELVVTGYRDWGVGHLFYDCPINRCAHISFSDKSDPDNVLVAVLVNMESERVVEISAVRDLLLSKISDVEEVRFFLSKYPDAIIRLEPGPGYRDVLYEAGFDGPVLSLQIRTTPTGEVIEISAQCSGKGPTFTVTSDVMEFLETTDCIE
jgi:hypothetical protein